MVYLLLCREKGNKYLPVHAVTHDAVWINSSAELQQCEGTECQSWVTDILESSRDRRFYNNGCAANAGRKHTSSNKPAGKQRVELSCQKVRPEVRFDYDTPPPPLS